MRKLAPGIYFDEEASQLNLDVPEFLADLDIKDTPKNRDLAIALATKVLKERGMISDETLVLVSTSDPIATHAALKREGVEKNVTIRRNHRCPCGSGLKYKRCCLGNN